MTVGAFAVAGTLTITAPFQSESPRARIWRSCETGTLRGWLSAVIVRTVLQA